ncbi:gephyrin-like molybdotransferase Glp [Microbacterium rhizomatis]|uniref:Molybdopterin molybdenumtransferase n=1 Tax=Microbacterium rhizomatis TaxID=1631477 RepID=A0A5J5J1T4_9MICO|nr:gephyrin-like molybdotransferase Glp [Microbacterium rhizomatis]KAA9107649.1 molybdopterin molybdotransferase MoeA [Microbacterium rhizomatis]
MAVSPRLDAVAESSDRDERTVDEHRRTILAAVRRLDHLTLPLAEAQAYTLAAPVRAAIDLPPFDNSAMDGFAVRFTDVAAASAASPALLRVVGDLAAGSPYEAVCGPGEAVRIMTGAPLPSGADTVVPFEATGGGLADSLGTARVVEAPRRIGAHIRRRGEDAAAGTELIPAGVELGPLQLSAIATAGVPVVSVSRRPRVAVIATGDELVAPGSAIGRAQIPESNSLLLSAQARAAGAEVILQRRVRDVDDDLRAAIHDAATSGSDAVITSGGVSAGAFEVVRTALAEMTFVRVAMQPGRPQGFAAGHPLLFGLPGNPQSAAVSFEVFVRPALLAMQGRTRTDRRMLRLPAATGWRSRRERVQYMPVVLVEDGVTPAAAEGSSRAAGLAGAAGYAVVPVGVGDVHAGDLLDVMLLP